MDKVCYKVSLCENFQQQTCSITSNGLFRWKGASSTNHCWRQKTRVQCIVWFCHKARVWQMDRQNYDSQDHASIAASRGKKKEGTIISTSCCISKSSQTAAVYLYWYLHLAKGKQLLHCAIAQEQGLFLRCRCGLRIQWNALAGTDG